MAEVQLKDQRVTVGQFVRARLEADKRRVASTGNPSGLARIYPEVAEAVQANYPGLAAAEKEAVFGVLKEDAERTTISACCDATAGLGTVSRILGI